MQQSSKRAAIYVRSAASQKRGPSFSTDAHIQVCIQYAVEHGYQVVEGKTYQEIASGATANRHALSALLVAAEKGEFDVLLIYDHDRLARTYSLLAELIKQFEEAGVTVEAVRVVLPTATTERIALYARVGTREKLLGQSRDGGK